MGGVVVLKKRPNHTLRSQELDSHSFLCRHFKFASEQSPSGPRFLDRDLHRSSPADSTSGSTIVDWKNFVREIYGEYFSTQPAVIEGIGHIVEIDESAWTKRKQNQGCQVSNQWVFDGIDRDIRDCFAVLVLLRCWYNMISSRP